MNLVLFQQAMQHITRISRILEMPGNNALLVGVGGSGKQSLARLSSFICGFEIDQLVVTASYTMTDLKNSLQEIYKKIAKPNAGPRVFLLTDAQIKLESFLIPINDMLNSGWIFDLFPKEDFDAMVGNIRNEAKAAGAPVDNADQLNTFFLDKIRRGLKVVLCFSPVGDTMRVRSRKFPGIINATSIDWFHPWPKDALIDVAYRFIKDIEFPTDELRKTLALMMAEVHVSIDDANSRYLRLERRFNYTTPKSFLELIDFYK
jgi:dynein heavy chain